MLNVLITVDTELYPFTPQWRETALSQEIDRLILGKTPQGEFGIRYQMDRLNQYGLKAVFLVESLFACAVGLEPLRKIVKLIVDGGHEAQLHIHTEWLKRMAESILPGRQGQHIKDFTEDEQALLIARGVENLKKCGAGRICAFRAGNFGANFDTLRALERNGISYDTSFDACYLDSICEMRMPGLLFQPKLVHGVYEFPVSCFQAWPGQYRHAQLCACSNTELENSLLWAWKTGWHSYVLVLHSFEMTKRAASLDTPNSVDRILVRRFERLCRFLAANRDKFKTGGFSEIDPNQIPANGPGDPFRSRVYHTAWRNVEQLASKVF